jgi:hypothetical protein
MSRRLVLVVGIGRSGTSLFTGILRQLGFRVPQPEVRADETNPRGFNEPRWVVDFHTRLMRERRVTVFDSRPAAWESTAQAAEDDEVFEELRSWLAVQFVGADNVVVKDPRIGWFLPLWLRVAEDLGVEPSFATMLRHPAAVVRSAREWYGDWQNDASRAAAWLNVTLHTEAATRAAPRVFVRYDDLLQDWTRELSRVAESLDIPWITGIDAASHPEIDGFVDPALRRSDVSWDDVPVPNVLRKLVDDVWAHASRLADQGGDDGASRASLDEARAAYVAFYADAESVAQSSVTAVKPRRRLAAALSSGGKRGGRQRPRGRLARRVTGLVPERQRERLRIMIGRGLGGRALLTLPVRMALLVPPRYRERVPLPVVRAGLRIVRALRR